MKGVSGLFLLPALFLHCPTERSAADRSKHSRPGGRREWWHSPRRVGHGQFACQLPLRGTSPRQLSPGGQRKELPEICTRGNHYARQSDGECESAAGGGDHDTDDRSKCQRLHERTGYYEIWGLQLAGIPLCGNMPRSVPQWNSIAGQHASPRTKRKGIREVLGWETGIEPATFGATDRRSTS
jgi:hypothetical protein